MRIPVEDEVPNGFRVILDEAPDFLSGYLEGRKWVADKFYDGDISKLSPLSSKIESLVNPPI